MLDIDRTCLLALLGAALCALVPQRTNAQDQDIPYFLHPCEKDDPNINQCLTYAANHLAMSFRRGIPELGVTEVEPIILDEINLSLGSGPDGYRATFRDVQAFGVSNLTVTAVRSDINTLQFQLTIFIPKITAKAHYRSSGVLIMVQASGGGDYWGEYGNVQTDLTDLLGDWSPENGDWPKPVRKGVRAKIYIRASKRNSRGVTLLNLEDLKMDFSVRNIKMGIENVHNGNAVIEAALNLFINSHSQELLREMKPTIKKKLMSTMKLFVENMFERIPYEYWIIE